MVSQCQNGLPRSTRDPIRTFAAVSLKKRHFGADAHHTRPSPSGVHAFLRPRRTVTAPVSTPHAPPIASSGSHVLVVDDDPRICTAYVEILSAHGYEVTVAKSRAETMAQLDRVGAEIDVLVLDLTLPDAEGAELARVPI